ncbi:MAG: hypothetical protein MJE77_27645 [Proteobacteria bacterium]|nr:hypothetical protein [Pseudomonadota bacterium]
MSSSHKQIVAKCRLYVHSRKIDILEPLGRGDQGEVFATTRRTAIKALHHDVDYRRERDVYLRLRERGVNAIRGCAVPQLQGFDDDLLVVEMTIVRPPCLVDFASAYLDTRPEFPPDVVAAEQMRHRETFGETWPLVAEIIEQLAGLGIHLMDISAGNIRVSVGS